MVPFSPPYPHTPPLPGDYYVVRYQAPVAVCTLNSESVARQVSDNTPDGLAIVGTPLLNRLGPLAVGSEPSHQGGERLGLSRQIP